MEFHCSQRDGKELAAYLESQAQFIAQLSGGQPNVPIKQAVYLEFSYGYLFKSPWLQTPTGLEGYDLGLCCHLEFRVKLDF